MMGKRFAHLRPLSPYTRVRTRIQTLLVLNTCMAETAQGCSVGTPWVAQGLSLATRLCPPVPAAAAQVPGVAGGCACRGCAEADGGSARCEQGGPLEHCDHLQDLPPGRAAAQQAVQVRQVENGRGVGAELWCPTPAGA